MWQNTVRLLQSSGHQARERPRLRSKAYREALGSWSSNGRLRTDIIRSRPIRPHSVFALRFRPPRWCGLRSPGFGRSANTSTSFSRRRLRSVTAKSHWSRRRSTELSLTRVREWNGDTGVAYKFRVVGERRLLAQSGRKCGMVELFCGKVDLSRYYDEGDSCSSLSLFKPPERCPAP